MDCVQIHGQTHHCHARDVVPFGAPAYRETVTDLYTGNFLEER